MYADRVCIQRKGGSYKVTGGHLPSATVYTKKMAQDIAEARLKLLERRTALLHQTGY